MRGEITLPSSSSLKVGEGKEGGASSPSSSLSLRDKSEEENEAATITTPSPSLLDTPDNLGAGALHHAAQGGHVGVLRLLLQCSHSSHSKGKGDEGEGGGNGKKPPLSFSQSEEEGNGKIPSVSSPSSKGEGEEKRQRVVFDLEARTHSGRTALQVRALRF